MKKHIFQESENFIVFSIEKHGLIMLDDVEEINKEYDVLQVTDVHPIVGMQQVFCKKRK